MVVVLKSIVQNGERNPALFDGLLLKSSNLNAKLFVASFHQFPKFPSLSTYPYSVQTIKPRFSAPSINISSPAPI